MKVIVELKTYMSVDVPGEYHAYAAERAVRERWDSYFCMRAEPMPEKGGELLSVKAVQRG